MVHLMHAFVLNWHAVNPPYESTECAIEPLAPFLATDLAPVQLEVSHEQV